MKILRVYVAGSYSANNVLDILKNIGKGEKVCADLFLTGKYAPFCPWHDKDYVVKNPDKDFTVELFYKYSIKWLEVSEIMLVLPGWETSKGTIAEMEIAARLGIPVVMSVDQLDRFYNKKYGV